MWMAKDKWGDKTRAAKGAKGSPARGQVKLEDGGDEELAPRRALAEALPSLPPPPNYMPPAPGESNARVPGAPKPLALPPPSGLGVAGSPEKKRPANADPDALWGPSGTPKNPVASGPTAQDLKKADRPFSTYLFG